MPHAIEIPEISVLTIRTPKIKTKSSPSRELRSIENLLEASQAKFSASSFSRSLPSLISSRSNSKTSSAKPITRILSLGLGSLLRSPAQSRRIKQLTIFLALANHLRQLQDPLLPLKLFAQDPDFTPTDVAFLTSLHITVLNTPATTSLGQAAILLESPEVASGLTLVYSPFLTIEAYALLLTRPELKWTALLGDDFEALREKLPKRSKEREEVEVLERGIVNKLRKKKAGSGEGFWEEMDKTFPMAVYWRSEETVTETANEKILARKEKKTSAVFWKNEETAKEVTNEKTLARKEKKTRKTRF